MAPDSIWSRNRQIQFNSLQFNSIQSSPIKWNPFQWAERAASLAPARPPAGSWRNHKSGRPE